jgi:integral membrane sensor domain MASE1
MNRTFKRPPLLTILILAVLIAIYFVAGKFGLTLAFLNASASAVWPPTGIAIAALVILGLGIWPAILIGAFLVNITTAGSLVSSAAIAAGNTLEAVTGAYLVTRFAGGRNAFARAPDVFRFVLCAGILATSVSATVGVSSLALTGYASWAEHGSIWLTWWLGDALGAMVVAPAIILWNQESDVAWNGRKVFEVALLVLCVATVGTFKRALRTFTAIRTAAEPTFGSLSFQESS